FAAPKNYDGWVFYVFVLCAVVYVLGGVIRLSFFNIGEEEKRETGSKEKSTYTGLPITTVTLIFPIIYLLRRPLEDYPDIFSLIWAGAMLAVGFLFVGKFHISKPSNKKLIFIIIFGLAIATAVGIIYGVSS
ncbi:MAG: hypothetical protein J6Z80_01815, partial [Clostridia bacterium]|nr:hypothetical protein [Clostridia bacterium]